MTQPPHGVISLFLVISDTFSILCRLPFLARGIINCHVITKNSIKLLQRMGREIGIGRYVVAELCVVINK